MALDFGGLIQTVELKAGEEGRVSGWPGGPGRLLWAGGCAPARVGTGALPATTLVARGSARSSQCLVLVGSFQVRSPREPGAESAPTRTAGEALRAGDPEARGAWKQVLAEAVV